MNPATLRCDQRLHHPGEDDGASSGGSGSVRRILSRSDRSCNTATHQVLRASLLASLPAMSIHAHACLAGAFTNARPDVD
jgi:hypothetical protein